MTTNSYIVLVFMFSLACTILINLVINSGVPAKYHIVYSTQKVTGDFIITQKHGKRPDIEGIRQVLKDTLKEQSIDGDFIILNIIQVE